MAPEEPRTSAGKMKDQYFSGLSANAKSVVAMMHRASPNSMFHFGLTMVDKDPVKLIANASAPLGILQGATVSTPLDTGHLAWITYRWMATESALQCQTFCQSVVEIVNMTFHQKYGRSAVKKRTRKFGRNQVCGGIAARSAGMVVS